MPSEVPTVSGDQSVEELRRQLAEAREQQTATAEILSVISSSPLDLGLVFAQVAASAVRLCDAYDAVIFQVDGEMLRLVAHHGQIPVIGRTGQARMTLTRGTPVGRAVLEKQTFHIADLQAKTEEYPEGSDFALSLGYRTSLAVPLVVSGTAVGAISIQRAEARQFTDRQIQLLKVFANQAVIAIENTRLFEAEQASKRELQESLEYQTATSEVLGVISRSPDTLQPVLDGIVATALRLCDARNAAIVLQEGDVLRLRAKHGPMPMRTEWPVGNRSLLVSRAVHDCRTQHIHDLASAGDEFPEGQRDAIRDGIRSILAVPLVREERSIGTIVVRRTEVKPFTDRQISLLQTFADQAVIAINNVGLFEEVQEKNHALTEANAQVSAALERETASSEILRAIGSSPTDVQPVFEAIARSGVSVCGALGCVVLVVDGSMIRVAATHGVRPERLERFRRDYPMHLSAEIDTAQTIRHRRMFHLADIENNPNATADDIENARLAGYRTRLMVPMVRADRTLGLIAVTREDPTPFPDQLVELLRTFADQAVIAIENTRLFEAEQVSKRELQESLEYQTATSEVLGVISRSPTELQPVLDAIAATAARLCESIDALVWRVADGRLRVVAQFGAPINASTLPLTRQSVTGRAIVDRKTIHVHDLAAMVETEYSEAKEIQQRVGHRTTLATPLLSQGEALGAISVRKNHVHPFSDRQIALLQTFADQAVIAIENARLFEEVQARTRELTKSLEQQTATGEILASISGSITDAKPVFDTIVRNVQRLFGTQLAMVQVLEDGMVHLAAAALDLEYEAMAAHFPQPLNENTGGGRAMISKQALQFVPVADNPSAPPVTRNVARRLGFNAVLFAPMIRGDTVIGAIGTARQEPKPFDDKQIALMKTFADQAVIAVENARLFDEVQARTRELARSVQELQALGEVGRAVSSTLDLKVVLKTIVDRAVLLSGTDAGSIFYYRGQTGTFELGETTGLDDEVVARLSKLDISARETGLGEAIAKREPLQIPDLMQRPSDPLRDAVVEAGFRASLIVPLLGAEAPLGTLILRRRHPGEFSAAVVSLMQSFADQSVIALENARLFGEIAQKGRELEIASQHKSHFVANMSHELRTPLAAMLGYAELLRDGVFGELPEKSNRIIERVQANGKHLLGLINSVLDISKIESGQFKLSLVEYSLDSMVETVRVATESLAAAKQLSFRTDVVKGLPYGLGDEPRLTQVLLNLVGNAIKFTDAGEVCISADAKDGSFVVSVSDTGPGIPDDECQRIFDKFHQVDSTSTRTKGGTGLGLAIAKEIVEMHGGRIWVESLLGRGSTFRMELPVRAQASGAAA